MRKRHGETLSDTACSLFLTAGLLPLLGSSKRGKVQALRTVETLLLSGLTVQALKRSIKARRPDSMDKDSFPSSHVMNTVAVATIASAFSRKRSPLWYGGAALIGVSRLLTRRHHPRDVVAGALFGGLLARQELSRRRGLFLPELGRRIAEAYARL